MRVITYDQLVAAPWANGGGITREIAAQRDEDGLIWRISLADVSSEGPFSSFAGLHRILTVIDGAGMVLETADAPIPAAPLAPVSFKGDLPVIGRLPEGPIRDLNVIFRPDRIAADVEVLRGPCEISPERDGTVLFVVAGAARSGTQTLAPLTTVFDATEPVVLSQDARALRITLTQTGA
ncbi:HutD family protein [Pararhodobacter sp.]|uniref:HutD/Ves family protein n=1 Tax=Pararhodobacter sp. TaxID=2127056 RepID=UPI002AFF6EAB|nr:HutD family protein [Pararhodobacter sp.]